MYGTKDVGGWCLGWWLELFVSFFMLEELDRGALEFIVGLSNCVGVGTDFSGSTLF